MVKNLRPRFLQNNPGFSIFRDQSLLAVPLKTRKQFIKYCRNRGLNITLRRLHNLEKIGVFHPIVRVFENATIFEPLEIPNGALEEWIQKKAIWDCYHPNKVYRVPPLDSKSTEAFYSIFQIVHLRTLLDDFTAHISLELYLDNSSIDKDLEDLLENFLRGAIRHKNKWLKIGEIHLIPILCQYISNRYYYYTQHNVRSFNMKKLHSSNSWFNINSMKWDWFEYVRTFDLEKVKELFELDKKKLRNYFESVAFNYKTTDPLNNWADLVQFVSVERKRKLKGDALMAQSLLHAADMLRLLFRDLFQEYLPPAHEINTTVIMPIPEIDQREDSRRYMEFVVNSYEINPQPKLTLFVEGQSEVILINEIFKNHFGYHPGKLAIKVSNLQGVANATGGKRLDRYNAILRLIDYLHDEQTMTFTILDREGYAEKLLNGFGKKRSIHGQARLVAGKDQIFLWDKSLEFDNFTDQELAKALEKIDGNEYNFSSNDVKKARECPKDSGRMFTKLYEEKTSKELCKTKLASLLSEYLFSPTALRSIENRKLVTLLKKVTRIANGNAYPILNESWQQNQTSVWLGGEVPPKW